MNEVQTIPLLALVLLCGCAMPDTRTVARLAPDAAAGASVEVLDTNFVAGVIRFTNATAYAATSNTDFAVRSPVEIGAVVVAGPDALHRASASVFVHTTQQVVVTAQKSVDLASWTESAAAVTTDVPSICFFFDWCATNDAAYYRVRVRT